MAGCHFCRHTNSVKAPGVEY